MEETQNSSRRVLYVGIGVAVIVVVAAAIIAFVLLGATKKEVAKKSTAPVAATVTDVKQSLAVLDSTEAQATADATTAATAISNATKPMKIGN